MLHFAAYVLKGVLLTACFNAYPMYLDCRARFSSVDGVNDRSPLFAVEGFTLAHRDPDEGVLALLRLVTCWRRYQMVT